MNWQSEFLERFELRLRDLLVSNQSDNLFCEALIYQFFPAGKRIRPLLMAALSKDFSNPDSKSEFQDFVLDFSCALEILHTSSLIHDDLPALDNDSERRGRATLHIKVGEGRALLVGDYLIARAFAICSAASAKLKSKSESYSALLANTFCDVCFGQDLDIRNAAGEFEKALTLYDLKTGALFYAALESARLLHFEDQQLFEQTKLFAKALGRSFQVLNDLKDIQTDNKEAVQERKANSDAKNQRTTALNLLSEAERNDFVSAIYKDTWNNLLLLEKALARVSKSEVFVMSHLRDVLAHIIMLPQ